VITFPAVDPGLAPPGGGSRAEPSSAGAALTGRRPRHRRRRVRGVPVKAAAGPVVPHRGPRIGVRGCFLHVAQRYPGVQTGRERFTSHAEWVSVMTGRWWHLPSSLRFFVAFAASCLRLVQPEWTQHPGIWRNTILSRPPGLRVRSVVVIAAQMDPVGNPLRRRPHAGRGMMHLMQLRALVRR
jgi:hypothetical protein